MHAFFRDLLDRFSRAAMFANAETLRESLRLMHERHLADVAVRRNRVLREAARRLDHRVRRVPVGRKAPAVTGRSPDPVLAAR